MIIGLTGSLAAGKGVVSDFLKEKGFAYYSVREFLTREIKQRGLEVNRDNMVLVANQLRKMNSPSYLVEKLYEEAKKENTECVIESLRTPGEINELKKKGDFILLAIDANQGIRYMRSQSRKSETDKISFEKFKSDEEREMFSTDPNKQNISECIKLADFKIDNNGTLKELNSKLKKIFEDIVKEKRIRPSWDEYFMKIAEVVGKRSTCDRGSSGCVIVRDKQILVTGYNGAAKGLVHCDDVGHQMKAITHEDGHVSQHCVRTVHGEQNAICQAAKFGISLEGATLYYKMTPCAVCAKMIINCGIKRVVCEKKYHAGEESEEMFKQAGIQIEFFNEEVEQYKNQ
jgi:dCMP deaminase